MRRFILLTILAVVVPSLLAKNPIPLRLVSFDPAIRKLGKYDAQQVTLALVEGRKAGKKYTVNLAPSQKTATLVGQIIYLRMPLDWLEKSDRIHFAGDLLDTEPSWIPPDFFYSVGLKGDDAIDRYIAGRITLDGINEINGTVLPSADRKRWTEAGEAIALAEKAAPDAVQGTFVFEVRGIGDMPDDSLWLNSAKDYRSPQSLNVALPPRIVKDLELRHKTPAAKLLKGRTVVVSGIARRVKIETFKAADSYYQTQIEVWSAHQVRILP